MKYSVEFENYILNWNSYLVFSYFQTLEKVKQIKEQKRYVHWGAYILFLQIFKNSLLILQS